MKESYNGARLQTFERIKKDGIYDEGYCAKRRLYKRIILDVTREALMINPMKKIHEKTSKVGKEM